ncbi:MAG: translation initiation factor IF-2 subunit alpha [Candidatus Aenigmatarchaeota archaeon]|nr:MAG: translation initiation factor IF-2 subunit alpha [Candidatus Aenigmarchaeota archaeon]RLJ08891.1 MAG: translation initiation factor IF-2 subunit alpha [Candidatus Aenigmarchaeota archaeon]
MRRKGLPERNELVVGKVLKIHPNSVLVQLIEYNLKGMVHVSEVASRWVRDIREFVREGQYVICRVMEADDQYIHLSLKRVRKEEEKSKLNEFKRERRAEKLLELAAKLLKKNLDQAYDEVGYHLQDMFGSLYKAFEFAWKNPSLLEKKGVPKKWTEALSTIAKKSYTEKVYEVKAELELVCYRSDGIEVIKKTLLKASEENGVKPKYISAPKYLLIATGKNYKATEAKIEKAAKEIIKEITKNQGEGSFKIVK